MHSVLPDSGKPDRRLRLFAVPHLLVSGGLVRPLNPVPCKARVCQIFIDLEIGLTPTSALAS